MDLVRPEKNIEWGDRKINIKALGKSGAMSTAKNIANILKELGKDGWTFEEEGLSTLFSAIVGVMDRIEGDLDKIILFSTDDVKQEELEAAGASNDFNLDLYLQIVEAVVLLNASQVPLILERAVNIKKQVLLIFKKEEEENPEEEPKKELVKMSVAGTESANS